VTDEKPRPTERDRVEPTVDQPLNAAPRPRLLPWLLLLAFVAALVLFYLFGLEFLVPAD
jgi:hypothetical protein